MTSPAPGELAFAYPIKTEDGMVRGLWEHKDGKWSTVVFRPSVVNAAKSKPIVPECTFTMDDLIRTATIAFTSDPAISDDKMAGKKLAAGILMFASSLGILDMQEDAT